MASKLTASPTLELDPHATCPGCIFTRIAQTCGSPRCRCMPVMGRECGRQDARSADKERAFAGSSGSSGSSGATSAGSERVGQPVRGIQVAVSSTSQLLPHTIVALVKDRPGVLQRVATCCG